MIRSLILIKIMIMGALNRLRFDLARELVVLISGGVVLATFAYIINDFLNVQISGLSQVMRDRFAEPVGIAVLLVTAFKAGSIIRTERSGLQTPSRMASFLGESPNVIRSFVIIHLLLVLAVMHGLAWWIVRRYLIQPDAGSTAVLESVMLVTTSLSGYWFTGKKKDSEHESGKWLKQDSATSTNKLASFVRWRLAQIALRNRTTRICFAVAAAMYLLLIPLQLAGIPFFASVACAILASIVASSAIFFQLSEDMNYAWAERTMGISHADFCKGYLQISYILAVPMIILALLCYSLGCLFAGSELNLTTNGLKLALINLSTPVIAPMLMFQIDARRPIINFILLTIAAMFIDTAIFANNLSLLLIPVLSYYANGSQNGRFYRA